LPQDAHVLCNSSLPRALFLACGGFDENMPFQRDDCEFGIWLWKMGGPSAIARKRESLRFPLSPRPCLG
jgi:hypothetical protein